MIRLIICFAILTFQTYAIILPIFSFSKESGSIYGLFVQQKLIEDTEAQFLFFSQSKGISSYLNATNIPLLNEDRKDLIARFISLIDNIYEKKNFLSISSSYPLTKIFCAKTKKYEFKRTYSRLMEIGSKSYISNVLEKS